MHEIGLVEEVIEIVRQRTGDAPIRRVVLEIGALAAVLPDAMRFAFEVCREGTPLAGAVLDLVETPGLARCRACGAEVRLDRPFGRCACGSADLDWMSGEELRIREVEVG